MSPTDDDVLVLGAGAIGLCCALYLLRAGRGVRVIDRGAVGQGASHGNCGTITPSHAPPLVGPGSVRQALRWMLQPDAPLYIRPRLDPLLAGWLLRAARRGNLRDWQASARARAALLHASRAELERLLPAAQIDCGFEASGLLYAFRDAARFDAMRAELGPLAELGIAAEPWDALRMVAEEPALKPGVIGGIWLPGDAQLRPEAYVAGLARAVREAGGIIEEHCEAEVFDHAGGRIAAVRTSCGTRRARQVVLALGAWSPRLARSLRLRLPIQPGKGYSITYTRPTSPPRRPMVLKERSVCVTSWADGFRLGSTMEFSGYDDSLNRTRLDALVRGASEYLHEPEGLQRVEEWCGWRPMSVDDIPLIGAAPGFDNLMLATGHGMLGITMSAATGRLVGELLSGAEPCIDPAPYSPARFG